MTKVSMDENSVSTGNILLPHSRAETFLESLKQTHCPQGLCWHLSQGNQTTAHMCTQELQFTCTLVSRSRLNPTDQPRAH